MANPTITALCIGTNHSPQVRSMLSYAERDALAVAQVFSSSLSAPGTTSIHLLGPKATISNVISALRLLRARPPKHLVLLFSGHGGGRGIALADGTLNHRDLRNALGSVPSRTLLSIFDCCHAACFQERMASFGGDQVSGLLDPLWIHALAHVTPGARAMFASAEDQNAYEDDRTGHGRFTGALLSALQVTPGAGRWLGLLASEAEVFECAKQVMRKRYGSDQGATGYRLIGDLPLVQSQHIAAIGGATVDAIATRTRELAASVAYNVFDRQYVPTRVVVQVFVPNEPILASSQTWMIPSASNEAKTQNFRVNPCTFHSHPRILRALALGYPVPIVWRASILDVRGRVLARNESRQTLAYRSGILRAA